MNDRPRLRFILWISGAFVVWLLAILLAPMVGAEQVDMCSAFAALTGNSQDGVALTVNVRHTQDRNRRRCFMSHPVTVY